ncbi:MAG: PqqD family protein, partial [Clostridia bacterium]|nr:PqqD family protein [Clostridia bacterium]
MKIKNGFELKEVADSFIAIPVMENVVDFSSVIMLNETAAFLWKILENEKTKKELVNELLGIYDVTEEVAVKDVEKLVEELANAGVLEGKIE